MASNILYQVKTQFFLFSFLLKISLWLNIDGHDFFFIYTEIVGCFELKNILNRIKNILSWIKIFRIKGKYMELKKKNLNYRKKFKM